MPSTQDLCYECDKKKKIMICAELFNYCIMKRFPVKNEQRKL